MVKKRWLLIALLVVIINLPILIVALGLDDYYLGNFLVGSGDYPTYLTKMKIGYDGGWQYLNRYTSEPHEPTYIFMFYIILGHVARNLNLGLHFTFHAARFILAFISLNILYKFIAKYADTENKSLVFLLSLFITALAINGFNLTQFSLYLGVMGYTHYMVTLPAMLIYFDSILEYSKNKGIVNIVKGCLAIIVLVVIHPFLVALAGLIAGATVLLNRTFKAAFPALLASGLVMAPVMSYFLIIFTVNPVLVGWRSQAVIEVAFLKHLFIFGIASVYTYILLALITARKIKLKPQSVIFPVWFIAAMLLSFTNLISSKLDWLFFTSIPVGVMSSWLISYIEQGQVFKLIMWRKPVISWVLIFLLIIPTLIIVPNTNIKVFNTLVFRDQYWKEIVSPSDKLCFDWLSINATKEDIIAAPPDIGNIIPLYTNSISYCGHLVETLSFAEKAQKLEDLLGNRYSDIEALDFFKVNGISYLVVKKAEQDLKYPCLTAVAVGDNIRVYKVE